MQCVSVAFPGYAFFLHCLKYSENLKKMFLSETTRSRALIFCIKHQLVNNIKICSNYDSGTEHGPQGRPSGAWPVSNTYL